MPQLTIGLFPSREQNSIIPTIEQPANAKTQPPPMPRHQHPVTALETPPVIPPRYSSLRPSFALRSPTLQSIKRTIRTASGRRVPRSDFTSDASNETVGYLTESSRARAIPMLPLHRAPRRGADVPGSFTAGRSPADFPAGHGLGPSRPGSRLQVRTPIAQQRSASARHSDGGRANPYGRGVVASEGFPREVTLASLYTASDTDGSLSSAGRDAGGRVGVAK